MLYIGAFRFFFKKDCNIKTGILFCINSILGCTSRVGVFQHLNK